MLLVVHNVQQVVNAQLPMQLLYLVLVEPILLQEMVYAQLAQQVIIAPSQMQLQ